MQEENFGKSLLEEFKRLVRVIRGEEEILEEYLKEKGEKVAENTENGCKVGFSDNWLHR